MSQVVCPSLKANEMGWNKGFWHESAQPLLAGSGISGDKLLKGGVNFLMEKEIIIGKAPVIIPYVWCDKMNLPAEVVLCPGA